MGNSGGEHWNIRQSRIMKELEGLKQWRLNDNQVTK